MINSEYGAKCKYPKFELLIMSINVFNQPCVNIDHVKLFTVFTLGRLFFSGL